MTFLRMQEYNLTGRVTIEQYSVNTDGSFSNIHKGVLTEDLRSDSFWSSLRIWNLSGQGQTQVVAIKAIRGGENMLSENRLRRKQNLANEANIWHNLEHFNVLPLLGYMEQVRETIFPSLVAPWCELGSLDRYIIGQSPRPADRISLMLQIMSAITYLHSHRIAHGDLKPGNIFLKSNYQVQLSDFGLSKIPFDAAGSRLPSSGTQNAGTLCYMGPEFFSENQNDRSPRDLPADIWALAWTFYMILTGFHPYSNPGMPGTLARIISCIRNHSVPLELSDIPSHDTPPENLAQLRSTTWPIMRECWNINPVHRPRADEVEQRLREAILLEHSQQFGGPMFDSQLPDETRPSVIGDEEALFLEMKGRKLRESNPNEARTTLVAAALGYHCHGHRDDAHTIQIQIGWILIDQQQFQAAQAHFEAVRGVANGDLIVACKRGLARTAVGFGNFDEATMQYGSALALCREGRFTDYEYMIIRETANAILGHPKNQGSPEENLRSRNMARELFKEALSLSMDPERTNLEYQVRVRCDLVQLERDAGNKSTAQSHALSAFRCALKTGQQNIAEEVYNYLLDSEVLSEAQYSAFYMELLELRPNNAHTSHGEIDSTSSSWVLHQP